MEKFSTVLIFIIFGVSIGSTAKASEGDVPSRFMPNETETSYLAFQQASGDEIALHAKYSFKYCLANFYSNSATILNGSTNSCRFRGTVDSNLYFSYTGEFDFYARTRPSDPVINRLSNPALHLQFKNNDWTWPDSRFKWIDIAFEHRSNGQVTEVDTAQEIARAQLAYDTNDHTFFDSISRGSNYFSLQAMVESSDKMTSYTAKLKKYVSQNTEITWGPLAGTNTMISDYDRVKLLIRHRMDTKSDFSIEWTIGDQGLSTDSINLSYLPNRDWAFPIYFRYHSGPMHTLSNYTENQNYLGFGFEFIP